MTCAQVLAAEGLEDDPAAQAFAAQHALKAGAFATVPTFVAWFESNWTCTLDLTAALEHEIWMRQAKEGDKRTPAALARIALRQIKATLCPGRTMHEKWQLWNALPDMRYHTAVIQALLARAAPADKASIKSRIFPGPGDAGVTTRAILGVFEETLGRAQVAEILRNMRARELRYRTAQRTAIQFLGLRLPHPVPGPATHKRKAWAQPATPPRPAARVCRACGSPLRHGRAGVAAALARG